jgi:hypothetical protein
MAKEQKFEVYVERFRGDKDWRRRILPADAAEKVVRFNEAMIERLRDRYPHARVICNPVTLS